MIITPSRECIAEMKQYNQQTLTQIVGLLNKEEIIKYSSTDNTFVAKIPTIVTPSTKKKPNKR